jgi:predicted nucleic acid-binding Zn ribbon protein
MPAYIYETVSQVCGEIPVRFEIQQRMDDPKLTHHPDTGAPVRRVISAGFVMRRNAPATSVGTVTDASWHHRD